MSAFGHMVRRVSLAALLALPLPAKAEIAARFDTPTGNVVVTGLAEQDSKTLLSEPDRLRLRLGNATSERGMLLLVKAQGADLVIAPRFPLRPGNHYRIDLALEDEDVTLAFRLPATPPRAPEISGFFPSQAVIPANALRLYVQFSEPMARGQLAKSVRLVRADGSEVESPFLKLDAELWDPSQTRATLLLDPGRIKQGLGPNLVAGPALISGEAYRLVIQSNMTSARGATIGKDTEIAFRAGPSERHAIVPENWRAEAPSAGSLAPLSVAFDRIMDSGTVARLLSVEDHAGNRIEGRISTDGGSWTLLPKRPWLVGHYRLRIEPTVEDVAGNMISAPFDAPAGTIGTPDTVSFLPIEIK